MVLILAIAVAGAYLSLAPEPPALAAVSGDVNCDETTNSIDALGVLRSIAGLSTPACNDAADVNCDDAVTAIDSLFILRFVAGLPVNLPGDCPPLGTAAGLPLLNEVQFLPAPGSDQFVELKNGGAGAASLDGLSLADESNQTYALPDGLPGLAEDEVLLIVFDGGSSVAGNVVHASPAGFLDSESGSVELRDGADVLDRVAWGEGQSAPVRLGRGGEISDPEPGMTIGRSPSQPVASDPSVWLSFSAAQATPGEPNEVPGVEVGLPLDGALFGPGDVALTWYPVAGAAQYHVQVSAEESFAAPLLDQTVSNTEVSTASLSSSDYFWRVAAIFLGGPSDYSAVQTFSIDGDTGSSVAPPQVANAKLLNVPQIAQKKDTAMLLLESDRETGPHAWDVAHPALDKQDRADNMNCALASLAMMNHFYAGDMSQDRIGYQVFKDRQPGPERDMNYGDGVTPAQNEVVYEYVLGVPPQKFALAGSTVDQRWDFIVQAIDAGDAVSASKPGHAFVIRGYYVNASNVRFVSVNDPWSGQYAVRIDRMKFARLWRPSGDPDATDEEPEVRLDSDSDGVVDFDETNRFHTNPLDDDTDRDEVTDKSDVHESVFGDFGYNNFGWVDEQRDWDNDGASNELDCDSDNDGEDDRGDPDDWSDPPTPPEPVSCGPGTALVTLSWNSVTDMNLWVLPLPAPSAYLAYGQHLLPGYNDDLDYECWLVPDNVTQRQAVVTEVTVDSHYIGVDYNHKCPYNPEGPHGSSDYVLTVHFADGRVEVYSNFLSRDIDRPGEFWRLYGPFDFAPPP